ncbi:hypothetical protein OFC51_30930, partial [Escherichia coli]|nr:hypothetical protein [Escherichia coli]
AHGAWVGLDEDRRAFHRECEREVLRFIPHRSPLSGPGPFLVVTPAMTRAGVLALLDPGNDPMLRSWEEIVGEVFKAMMTAAGSQEADPRLQG